MEDRIIEAVHEIASAHEFLCYVVASAGGSIWRGGDCEGLNGSLVNVLFGGIDEAKGVFDFLDGRMLPQVYRQGDVFCLLMKPTIDIVVGFFAQDGRNGVNLHREGKEVSKDLEQRIGG
ncbi:MAG: hypothetical protein H7Z16_06935 [Pyrinomonadaceae bacterium]|nr:hypothetical protein [Pyrinomonadaceae bacterium]